MRKTVLTIGLFGLIGLAGLMTACSNSDDNNTATEGQQGGLDDEGGKVLTEGEYTTGINDFSFSMLQKVVSRNGSESTICSPVSAASLLAMMNDGATDVSRKELLKVLGFSESNTEGLNKYFQKLMVDLPATDKTTTMHMANAMYVRKSYEFLPAFTNDMKLYYGATAETLDFDTQQAVEHINAWCNTQTEGIIPEIIKQIEPQTLSILVNAICFKGKWTDPFISETTQKASFKKENGNSVQVDMMGGAGEKAEYYEAADYEAVRMNYGEQYGKAGQYAMTVILPKEGKKTADIISSLNATAWKTLSDQLKQPTDAVLTINMPRFTVQTKEGVNENLIDLLTQMGVPSIFSSETSTLTKILKDQEILYVSKMMQRAKINVTEEGTEAAAVTYVGAEGATGGETKHINFKANHPFIYVISDRTTGVVYFLGTFQG